MWLLSIFVKYLTKIHVPPVFPNFPCHWDWSNEWILQVRSDESFLYQNTYVLMRVFHPSLPWYGTLRRHMPTWCGTDWGRQNPWVTKWSSILTSLYCVKPPGFCGFVVASSNDFHNTPHSTIVLNIMSLFSKNLPTSMEYTRCTHENTAVILKIRSEAISFRVQSGKRKLLYVYYAEDI